jgi:hypothetical protein
MHGEDAFGWREQAPDKDEERDEEWKAGLGRRLTHLCDERDPDAYLFREFDEPNG